MGSRRPGAGTLLAVVERGSRQVAVEDSHRGLEEAAHSHREVVDRIVQVEADRSLGTPYLSSSSTN